MFAKFGASSVTVEFEGKTGRRETVLEAWGRSWRRPCPRPTQPGAPLSGGGSGTRAGENDVLYAKSRRVKSDSSDPLFFIRKMRCEGTHLV